MSFNQFSPNVVNGASNGTYVNSANGTAVLNSTVLPSPLTGSTYCRLYSITTICNSDGTANIAENKVFISSSVNNGLFVDTSNSASLSLRAKVRIKYLSSSDLNRIKTEIGLFSYALPSSAGNGSGFYGSFGSGYELCLRTKNNTSSELLLKAGQPYNPSNVLNLIDSDINLIATCSGTYNHDTWHHIRMDVIPLSLTQKNIIAFTSSDGGQNWSQLASVILDSSSPQFRMTGYNGYKVAVGKGGSNSNCTYNLYIDDFEAYVAT